MSIKSRYTNGLMEFFDSISGERVRPIAPCYLEDDFLYRTLNVTDRWLAIDVSVTGNTTPVQVASGGQGVARLPLDVTAEAQESGLTFGDSRMFVLNRGLVFEARVALSTLPTLLSIGVWGVAGNKNAVANTVAESAWFRVDGSGVVTVETDDTVNETTQVATGVTLVAGQYAICKIDMSNIADVRFYIDGNRVAAGTTFTMAQVPALALQPYFHLAKASGAGLGVMDIDYVRVWSRRS